MRWERTTGLGTVFSWTRTHHPFLPELARALPYVCAVVELDEGPRILSGLRLDGPTGSIGSGRRVGVRFEARDDGSQVAVFVPLD
jgi:uncharacterized OB-fold protein